MDRLLGTEGRARERSTGDQLVTDSSRFSSTRGWTLRRMRMDRTIVVARVREPPVTCAATVTTTGVAVSSAMDFMISAVRPRNTWPNVTPNSVLAAGRSARCVGNCCRTNIDSIRIASATNIAPRRAAAA